MRRSLEDIVSMVRDVLYPAPLPREIARLHAYVLDGGHCLMCVPKAFLADAQRNGVWQYEVPLPVKYVLAVGWEAIEGTDAVAVNVPYDPMMGAMVPDGYDEF